MLSGKLNLLYFKLLSKTAFEQCLCSPMLFCGQLVYKGAWYTLCTVFVPFALYHHYSVFCYVAGLWH